MTDTDDQDTSFTIVCNMLLNEHISITIFTFTVNDINRRIYGCKVSHFYRCAAYAYFLLCMHVAMMDLKAQNQK